MATSVGPVYFFNKLTKTDFRKVLDYRKWCTEHLDRMEDTRIPKHSSPELRRFKMRSSGL
jgi:hypothetical protein